MKLSLNAVNEIAQDLQCGMRCYVHLQTEEQSPCRQSPG